MDAQVSEVVFSTHELPKLYPPAAAWKTVAAGLLAVRLSNVPGDYLLWFRPEVVQTVYWSGNPEKAITREAGSVHISPRKSFEKWLQLVEGSSQPWQAYELETALALRNDVKDFIFQKYREVQQTNRELTEAYDDLETFSYSISHDLRAPLRTIEGYSDLLKENYGEALGKDGLHLLETIKDNSIKLTDLISGLLAYTRAGKKNLILNRISLDEVVRHELTPLMEAALQQGRKVDLLISNDLPTVVADKPALIILLKNLLSNAFKYTANSNPTIIEIGGSETNGFVQFFVKDNGIGFDMQHAGRIFGVFNRLVNDEQFDGTGIGLAIVKRIVEKHNGTVTVESNPDKGTTFFVRMPVGSE
jgi:light-regulated signal transduction histidine kinase (bacteriophytochrome)